MIYSNPCDKFEVGDNVVIISDIGWMDNKIEEGVIKEIKITSKERGLYIPYYVVEYIRNGETFQIETGCLYVSRAEAEYWQGIRKKAIDDVDDNVFSGEN